MVKIFRRIRLQLLSENPPGQLGRSGKFGKYLLYAIGEIVLVVIGILIALQVNNWNERRKLKVKETSLLESLEKELTNNIGIIASNLTTNNDIMSQMTAYINEDNSSKTDSEKMRTTVQVANYEAAMVSYPIMENVLTSEADLVTVDQNLQAKLRQLEIRYKYMEKSESYLDEFWNSELSGYLTRSGYIPSFVSLISNSKTDNKILELYNDPTFVNYVSMKWIIQSEWIRAQELSLSESKDVLAYIQTN